MQFFTSICLVSVGFASWTFVSGDSITASGNIVAQDVHSNDNYIKLDSSNSKLELDYYETGFITSQNTISLEGNLSTTYNIYVEDCFNDSIFPEKNSLDVKICLETNGDVNLYDLVTTTHSITSTSKLSNYTSYIEGNMYYISFTLKNVLTQAYVAESSIISIDVNYLFTVETSPFFRANIYPYMNTISFSSFTSINGGYYEE